MNSHLKSLCNNLNIELIYTDNKYTVLSNGSKNSIPVIRANKVFRNCPRNVAEAIIEYYFFLDNENLNLVEEYLEQKNILSYKIKVPIQLSYPIESKAITKKSNKTIAESEIEANISHIILKDFKGNKSYVKPNEAIKPLTDNIYELDVTVDYIDT
ncbi:hypothetical protein SAMN05660462_00820 [Proteiniborus ethanoligenes]|uniref:Uncharacterized protein n=1 Tax=Proteiniborus ethanoligenes TaxID=415015 RepID=A0A1H3MFM1_9FIRM|nr:hypothetical protein [Proteiniborus ethanoligenes]SDY75098.1 hypothetical protein SAMN05660462_00820 [Proteiniborus ethanoligenes]